MKKWNITIFNAHDLDVESSSRKPSFDYYETVYYETQEEAIDYAEQLRASKNGTGFNVKRSVAT